MMVMGYDEERLLLVLQIDHSRVAGLLAAHWGKRPVRPTTPLLVHGAGSPGARQRLVRLGDTGPL